MILCPLPWGTVASPVMYRMSYMALLTFALSRRLGPTALGALLGIPNPLPGSDILDAECGRQALFLGKPEPLGHGLTVKIHVQRLMPMRVLQLPHHLAIHPPFDDLLVPFQRVDMEAVSKIKWRFPGVTF